VNRGGCLVCQEIDGEVAVPDGPSSTPTRSGRPTGRRGPTPRTTSSSATSWCARTATPPDWAALTDDEAADVGAWVARLSRALQGLGATRVYTMTLGHAVDHLHVHLVPRWPETPEDVTWQHVDDYPGARRGSVADAAELAARLRDELWPDPSPATRPGSTSASRS
jgi:histidine triad (HIT) family protein